METQNKIKALQVYSFGVLNLGGDPVWNLNEMNGLNCLVE